MGVFDDKKFDQLDWISQATEPIDSELNEMLSIIPDEIDVDFWLYKNLMSSNYSLNISIYGAMRFIVEKYCNKDLHYYQVDAITPCFEFRCSDDIAIDFEQKKIIGSIKLVKRQNTIDSKVLEQMLGKAGCEHIPRIRHGADINSRANDIMELLGKCQEGITSRSSSKKIRAMLQRCLDIFHTNEWNIRDTELADKVGKWIYQYVNDGNLAAYSNFCRLKVMTHKDQPIYSMEESV